MILIHGSYQSLEKRLPRFIEENKCVPQDKTLIVAPSARMARYLSVRVTESLGVTSNIAFLKFSALVSKIDKEFNPFAPPVLESAPMQEFILKNVISGGAAVKRGYVLALKSTLRDMADSLADDRVLKEHAAEGAFGSREDNEHVAALADIYARYYAALRSVPGARVYGDYFASAAENIPRSKYLAQFKKIIFYGFYDFTGAQLEIFNAVRANFDCAVFFPYLRHPAFKFVSGFFETNILGSARETEPLEYRDQTALNGAEAALFNPLEFWQGEAEFQAISASGVKGELYGAAKAVLDLVENKGYKFEDIAVCARSFEGYQEELFNIFEENKIPLNSSAQYPLLSHPLAVFCFNLLNLARGGFERGDVQSVVQSPYFARKNKWKFIIKDSLAERGLSQWESLLSISKYAAAFLFWLKEINAALSYLNKPYPWDALAARAEEILEKYTDGAVLNPQEKNIFNFIKEKINELKNFSLIKSAASEGEFLEELQNILSSETLARSETAQRGVTAGGVMGLRGQNFKAIILLGANEKIFPAVVREDPLLRDNLRRVMRDVQGFWISRKLDRFDEEKFLFFLSVTAARERLIISFRRSDEEGKAMTPSLYLSELCRAAGVTLEKNISNISRRELEKYFETPDELLNAKEMSVKISSLKDPRGAYETAGINFEPAVFDAAEVMSLRGELGAYDGIVDKGPEIFEKISAKGFSASALQVLALCPQRYYNKNVLGLEEEEENLKRDELAPNLKGGIYHKILQRVYNELKTPLSIDGILAKLENILELEIPFERYKELGLYPVIWKVYRRKMKEFLSAFLVKDAESMAGFIPSFFEAEISSAREYGGEKIRLRGYIDRIDVRDGSYRIIDYKTAQNSLKDLTKVVFKKKYLQPVLYPHLAAEMMKEKKFESFSFLNIEKGYFRRELGAEDLKELEEKFASFMTLILSFIKYGKFFINEGGLSCPYCGFAGVCRKGSGAALVRARSSEYYKELESYE